MIRGVENGGNGGTGGESSAVRSVGLAAIALQADSGVGRLRHSPRAGDEIYGLLSMIVVTFVIFGCFDAIKELVVKSKTMYQQRAFEDG